MRFHPRRAAATFGLASALYAHAAFGATLTGRTFVVDPGHGTELPSGAPLNVGAVGPNGVEERAVVLAVGEDLARLLRDDRATVFLTRSRAQPFRTGTSVRLDNRARAAFANRLHATAFVAIHADASTSPSATGTSVFWLRPNSAVLARAMRRELLGLGLGEAAFRVRDLAVTNEARVPAVLVELGFVSNPVQGRLLATPAFQARAASALYAALRETYAR